MDRHADCIKAEGLGQIALALRILSTSKRPPLYSGGFFNCSVPPISFQCLNVSSSLLLRSLRPKEMSHYGWNKLYQRPPHIELGIRHISAIEPNMKTHKPKFYLKHCLLFIYSNGKTPNASIYFHQFDNKFSWSFVGQHSQGFFFFHNSPLFKCASDTAC